MTDITLELARADYFKSNPTYYPHVKTANLLYAKGMVNEAMSELNKLPSDKDLFEALVKKLENKSAFKNLKKIAEGKLTDKEDYAVATASLLTHILIEKKNNPEYQLLVEPTLSKLFKLL